VSAQGALYDCKVRSETPAGQGFGQAAVALTTQMLMRPGMKDGKPVAGAKVGVPVNFHMPAGASPGSSIDAGPSMVGNIPWRTAPTVADVLAVYPAKARANALGGRATLSCRYTKEGHLRRCEAVNVFPAGAGFGEASLKLAGMFQGPPLGGELVNDEVKTEVVVTFAAESLTGRPVIGKPRWIALPKAEDIVEGYPEAALKAGVDNARVVLGCKVQDRGTVGDCRVTNEEPAGYGIGQAALKLAPGFRLAVWTMEGLPTVGGQVNIPVVYQDIGPEAAPPAPVATK
jgi:hypothetical protein